MVDCIFECIFCGELTTHERLMAKIRILPVCDECYARMGRVPDLRRRESNVVVTARDLQGQITDVTRLHNLLTTAGLNMERNGLYGDVSDLEVKYMGIGDDSTTPALADTTLGNETFRKARTSQSKPADGAVLYTQYVAPAEAVGAIEEMGWFAGAAAGAGADTGIMIARVLYTRTKTNLESLQIERTDTFAEA